MKNSKLIYASAIILVLVILLAVFLFVRSAVTSTKAPGGFFGFGGTVSTVGSDGSTSTNTPVGGAQLQKVFKIANGPVAGATFVQTFAPTTTLARYVMADNGHILDLSIDTPGAVARPVSNTTIPGVYSVVWGQNGTAGILQYSDTGVSKSVYLSLATSSTMSAVASPLRIQFLPNNIASLAASPNGGSVAYLLATASGSDGYIGNIDGTDAKKIFSVPLSQVLLSWPATSTLLLQEKSAVGVPGIALAIDAASGATSPLLYTSGLSIIANSLFSKIVYQTSADATKGAVTYAHDVATGKDTPMANDPLPEKCAWSPVSVTNIYCALPVDTSPTNYLDIWHQGLVQTSDGIFMFDANNGTGAVITLPGDGGANSPIDSLSVSADGKYLLFITRGDHSLWGVRLQ